MGHKGNNNTHHQLQSNGQQHQQQQQNGGTKFLPAPTSFHDVVLGILTQLARKYMFIDASKKAMAYLLIVIVLSLFANYVELPNGFYFVQKHNVFNQLGTKMGWFWTLLLLCPFTWMTSLLHHESKLKAAFDLFRLLIATGFWYMWTNSFVKFEHHTGKCHGSPGAVRSACFDEGGKWIPGFDISGHAFLLLYSILVICEEATSFQNWPSKPRVSVHHIPSRTDFIQFRQKTTFIQAFAQFWNFVLLCVLHLFWDAQLLITALYYHEFWQKCIGASVALFSWFVTYRFWFMVGFPFLPIRRHIKSF